jgi:hypothetical protein
MDVFGRRRFSILEVAGSPATVHPEFSKRANLTLFWTF